MEVSTIPFEYDNITNGSEIVCPSQLLQSPVFIDSPEAIVVPLVFCAIFSLGVIGNGLLIFIVIRNRTMHNTPNIFIVSLAIGDLLLIFFSVPFTATIYTFVQWPYGHFMCKFNEFMQTLSLGVSVFTLTVLSWDRYTAISNPMQTAMGNPLRRTFIIVAVVWVLAIALAFIDGVQAQLVPLNEPCHETMYFCDPYESQGEQYQRFYAVFRFVVYFALPVIFITVFYLTMARTLIHSFRKLPGEETNGLRGTVNRQIALRKKVAKIVLSFVVIFIICWLPRHIYIFWYVFDPQEFNMFWHIFKIVGFCLMFINSCINPLALYFLSKQFRLYYNQYLLCFRRQSAPRRIVSNTNPNYTRVDTATWTSTPIRNLLKNKMQSSGSDSL